MSQFFKQACDVMDAEVFSGDALLSSKTRKQFKEYLGRWQRALEQEEKENCEEASSMTPSETTKIILNSHELQLKTIFIWKWEDAPEEFKTLSHHGGDEDWVAFIPDSMKDEYISWMEEGTSFGCCDISEHSVPGGVVRIGAHA